MNNCTDPTNQCPITTVMDIVGGKWKLPILWHLSRRKTRFNELQRKLVTITQRTLTLQLRELERDGMVLRKIYPEVPPRVEYSLTELGNSIRPIIKDMCRWGAIYNQANKPDEKTVADFSTQCRDI